MNLSIIRDLVTFGVAYPDLASEVFRLCLYV